MMRGVLTLAAAMAVAAWALAQASGPASAPSGPHRLIRLEGQALAGTLKSVTPASVTITSAGQDVSVPLDEIRGIQLGAASAKLPPGQKLLRLRGGQVIFIDRVDSDGGKLTVYNALAGKLTFDLPAVRSIVLPSANQPAQEVLREFAALNLPPAARDYLLAVDKKGLAAPYPGIFKGIAGGKVTFELEGAERTIDLESVRLVELAGTGEGMTKPRGEAVLADGSVIPFGQIGFDMFSASGWTVGVAGGASMTLPPLAVAEVRIFSDRLTYLSELAPVRQEQAGTFDGGIGFDRDRSTTGQPIRLGGVTYSRGLGLHSRCVLTYQLDGRYSLLLAKAGIDDNAARAGRAVLSVLADGKKLLDAQPLAAGEAPRELRLDLKGVKELTILADFSPDGLDVGGHVDLADAVLVK